MLMIMNGKRTSVTSPTGNHKVVIEEKKVLSQVSYSTKILVTGLISGLKCTKKWLEDNNT